MTIASKSTRFFLLLGAVSIGATGYKYILGSRNGTLATGPLGTAATVAAATRPAATAVRVAARTGRVEHGALDFSYSRVCTRPLRSASSNPTSPIRPTAPHARVHRRPLAHDGARLPLHRGRRAWVPLCLLYTSPSPRDS